MLHPSSSPSRVAGATAFLLHAGMLSAQARDTTIALPGVVVTATRGSSSTLATPLAVNKITAPDLRMVSGYGLEDALARVPGVIAQSRYGTSDVRLIIRGFGARGSGDRSNSGTSRGVRVLIDGFPETEPDGRTAFDHIDLATAEAVEVIRSNASSLWGNAAGGVVNVFSVPSVTEPMVDFQPVYGDFGLRRLAFRTAAPIGNGTAWLSVTNSTFDGWRQHSDARRVVVNTGVTGNIGENSRVGVHLVAANNLMHIPGPLTQAQVDANPRQAHADYLSRDERRYNRLGRLGVSLEHSFDSTTSLSSMFYVNPKYLQRSERNTFRDFTRYHLGGNIVGKKRVTFGQTESRFSAGIDEAYQDGSIQFYALAAGSTRGALSDNKGEGAQNVGFFLQDELEVNDRLTLLVGARYDKVGYTYRSFLPTAPIKKQSKDFDRVSPKLGVSYLLGKSHSVYANVGGGVEVPAGNETDQPPTGPLPGALLNPLLDAINSTTYEAGFKALTVPIGASGAWFGYDIAAYHTDVSNEIIPYNGGRYYQTAAKARRDGLELGLNAMTKHGIFANAAFSFNDHKYAKYIVDSAVIDATKIGKSSDLSGNQVMGVPKLLSNIEAGTEIPGLRAVRIKGVMEHSGKYFANDANTVVVPAYTIYNVSAELRQPIIAANGWGIRGFVTVHNVTNQKYIGSAFLNPDLVGGQPAAFEPGMPKAVSVSFSVGKLR
jgi:iron complex outermembrane receptor protein